MVDIRKCCWVAWKLPRRNRLTSMIFLLVRDSWGSLYSVYLRRTLSMSVLAYWYSLLLELKIIRAISQSHSTDSSYAFFITPNFLLLNVTCWRIIRNQSPSPFASTILNYSLISNTSWWKRYDCYLPYISVFHCFYLLLRWW